jgi:hypothetical protein
VGESCAGDNEDQGRKRTLSGPASTTLPRVLVAVGSPGPLADSAGPDTARWPASGMQALPPLALGGMGGSALTKPSTIVLIDGVDFVFVK